MDATQFFSLTNQRSPLVNETSSATPLAKVEGSGAEFADLFKAQIQFQMRQEFAVPVESLVELQVVPLGPTINLITANTPIPDMSSLATFARAQGLDEEAVKTLFGHVTEEVEKPPVDLLQLPVLSTPAPQMDPMYLGALPVAPLPNTTNSFVSIKSEIKTVSASTILAGSEVSAVAEKPSTLDVVDVLRGSKVIISEISVQPGVVIALTQPIKVLDSNPILPVAANGISAVATEVLRVRLEAPSEAVTQKLSDISGAKEALSWHALLASAALARSEKTVLGAGTELLNIEVPPGLLADLEEDTRIDVPSSGSAPLVTSLGDSTRIQSPAGGAGDMAQNASAEQRSEQYQQLADRLGQAVAHKLLAQIERGEWKLQLRLQPESLGRVDVALEMHSGGLDALFTAENGVTRELIAQGSAKLRDALTQSGMAVASVFVNSDQGRQSDGNPTSGQSFKGGSGAARDKEEESVAAVNVAKRQTYSVDGLDVLA